MTLKKYIMPCVAAAMLAASFSANAGRSMMTAGDNDDTNASATDTTATTDTSVTVATVTPNYIDEILWVVGDEAILRSDVEMMRLQAEENGMTWDGDPECRIPEQIAVQKLFINQAILDSIEVTEAEINQGIEQQINGWVQMIGSREKLEEYRKQSISQIKESLHDEFKNREMAQRMRRKIVENVMVTPAEVREFFNTFPEDSIPFVPTTVEVQILTNQPLIPIEDINKVKDELREYTERVQSGNTSFATLARLYSEDPGSARQGGELGYTGRGMLDPNFAQVAFNLTDPKKISKIVESEFGFHIIQLIDRRGDKVNVRHILRKPRTSQEQINITMARMDSICTDLRNGLFTFEEGATVISDDKDTKNNQGLMSNITEEGRTSRFQMKDLPTEVARVVDTMKVGEISAPFTMINARGKTVCAIVKLKSRLNGHKASITEDYQVLNNIVLERQREKVIRQWIQKKIKETYVHIDERYKNGDFEYEGWIR